MEFVGLVGYGEEWMIRSERSQGGDVDGNEDETGRTKEGGDCRWLETGNCHLNVERDMAGTRDIVLVYFPKPRGKKPVGGS